MYALRTVSPDKTLRYRNMISKHKKVQTNAYLFEHGHTVFKFSCKSPLLSHKMTLKQQINGQKQWKMKEKDFSCFGWVFTACLVLGRLLATEIHYYYKITCCSALRSDTSASSPSSDEGNSLLFFLLVFVGDGFFLFSWHTDTRVRLHW